MAQKRLKCYFYATAFSFLCTVITIEIHSRLTEGDLHPDDPLLISNSSFCQPDQRVNSTSWFQVYSQHLLAMKEQPACPSCKRKLQSTEEACARWWHTTPQRSYGDYPPRKWKEVYRPLDLNVTPCSFGQAFRPPAKCSGVFGSLFRALDSLRVVYFPRSGSELGIVRGSAYLSRDGDVDIYVDMPPRMLLDKLKNILVLEKPWFQSIASIVEPVLHLEGGGIWTEVHMRVLGCPEVNMVHNDWASTELEHRAGPADLCSCRMNSVDLLCHKDAEKRMYLQYGPSWRIPLGVKCMDMPYWAFTHTKHKWTKGLKRKLGSMVNQSTGFIEKEAVISLCSEDEAPSDDEMPLILAQLNLIAINLPSLSESAFWSKITLFLLFMAFVLFLNKIRIFLKCIK